MKYLLLTVLACYNINASAFEIDREDVHCLVQNLYFEARDQGITGMIAVGEVTLNRVESDKFPNTICEVVWQPKQFSWTHDGKSDKMKNKKAREHAYLAAYAVLHHVYSLTEGSTHYHSVKVSPFWADSKRKVKKIGDHIFYRL